MLKRRACAFHILLTCITCTAVYGSQVSALAAKAGPSLRAEFAARPVAQKNVIVVTRTAPVGQAAKTAAVTAQRGGVTRFSTISANLAKATKLAARSDVLAILPDIPPDPPKLPNEVFDALQPFSGAFRPAAMPSATPQTWVAKDVHHASDVWAMGFTGEGVKVAICDTGIDFGHPDLQGCQARVENPESPYYGWPIVFNPYAMYRYALYHQTVAGYVNTSFAATGPTAKFNNRIHTLTGTSQSGVYHFGLHPGYHLMWRDPWGLQPSVLVVDEHQPGVYDTVYVDLNKNLDFRDDKPCFKGDEISWHDFDGDGLADESGGMVYFIADGVHPIPASDWLYGLAPPSNGCLVALAGAFDKEETHGTLCASAVVAQGIIGAEAPSWKPEGTGGMVQGMAPGAKIVSVGNIYKNGQALYDGLRFCLYGYDGIADSGDEPDIVNMSFGYSSIHADGWDFLARYLGQLVRESPRKTFIAAAGNGGPGFGTLTTPGGSPFVIAVGASTLYGSTQASEDIASLDQITYGDVQPWSARGPNSLGQIKPDVVATGSIATGDLPLAGDGNGAWGVWAGTSLSSPVTCGIAALLYQAYMQTYGDYPTWDKAREILKSSCTDLGYEPLVQGSGMLDAKRAVLAAMEQGGITVSPDTWNAGDYRGTSYEAFPNLVVAGQTYTRRFEVRNHGDTLARLALIPLSPTQISRKQISITTLTANEDGSGLIPSYLIDIGPYIAPGADLVRIRLTFPYEYFSLSSPTSTILTPSSNWVMLVYQWTDLNGDGKYWNDCCPANGLVNEGEIEPLELARVTSGTNLSDYNEVSIGRRELGKGRLLLALQHTFQNAAIPSVPLTLTFDSYSQRFWKGASLVPRALRVPPHASAWFDVRVSFPFGQQPGLQTGYIRLTEVTSDETTLVPVAANVVSTRPIDNPHPKIVDGVAGEMSTYLNGAMFGSFDWSWRPECGDWRFFFLDVPEWDAPEPAGSAQIVANASWQATPTDIDLLIQGPTTDSFSQDLPEIYGPHGATLAGGSRDTNFGDGKYPFQTASGGASEWVSGPLVPGLHLVQAHAVLYGGRWPEEPYSLQIGKLWCKPVELVGQGGTAGRLSAQVWSNLRMPDIKAQAYGLSQPIIFANQDIKQNIVDSPNSATWRYYFTVADGGLLRISTSSLALIDIDLYLLRDANNDGQFDWGTEMVAISANNDANEFIEIRVPESGKYMLVAHGFSVAPSPSKFDMNLLLIQGKLPTTIVANLRSLLKKADVVIEYPAVGPGTWEGLLIVGPRSAPTGVAVPIKVDG